MKTTNHFIRLPIDSSVLKVVLKLFDNIAG